MLAVRERPAGRTPWKAELALTFRRDGLKTVLAERRHLGPLMVQKPLYPEGPDICHMVVVHAPGGVAGGDELKIDIGLEAHARALLTTPAAGKWYKSDGRPASQRVFLAVAAGAKLEWLPQETILFDAASARLETAIDLADDAVFAGWEISCLGRRLSGESFENGHLRQSLAIRRAGRLVWNERLAFAAGDRIMQSPVGLGGRHVFGTMVVAAGALPGELLDACRGLTPLTGEQGITALPDIVAARYLGQSAEHAVGYFESLRAVLRPWYAGRPAVRPRLWNT
jgi:urease accessory protein